MPAEDSSGRDLQGSALLIMDYQNGVVDLFPQAETLLRLAAEAIGNVRARGGYIVYVRVAFEDADYDRIPPHGRIAASIAAAGPTAYHADSPTTAIHDRVAPQAGDIVVRKTRVGAFSTTDLDRQLRERGVTDLILAGLSTSGVLLTTVREASDRDYRLYVLSDASSDRDPDVHTFLMERIFPRQAQVMTVSELTAATS